MYIFEELQEQYAYLGVYPIENDQQSVLNIKNVITMIILTQGFITSNVYLFFEAKTFNEYVDSFWVGSSTTLACLNYAILVRQTPYVFNFIRNFELTIQERMKSPISKVNHEKTIQDVQKWSKALDIFMVSSVRLTIWPKLFVSFHRYFTTDLGNDAFELPYAMWYPFDWRDPFKYFIAFFLQYALFSFGIKHSTCHTSFVGGTCWMFVSFTKDLSNEVNTINSITIDVKRKLEVIKRISNFVQIHATAMQLVNDFSTVFRYIILFFFLWCTVTTAGALLVIKIEINAADLSILPVLISQMCWSLGYAYIFCEFGDRSNNGFEQIYNETCQLDWYSFPNKVQQMMPIIMNAAQNSATIRSSQKIQCTREFFKGMWNSAFTYFTMLRQFGH